VRLVLLIFLAVFIVSCFNPGDCVITATNLVKVILLNTDGAARKTTFLKIVTVEDGHDFLGDSTVTGTSLRLPLHPDRLQTTFQFLTSDSISYTLQMKYTTFTRIIGADCGAFLYYENLSVDSTQTNFEKTRIINHQLFTSVPTNLELYF